MASFRTVLLSSALCLLALPAGALADPVHVVSAGESLASIAAADGLSVSGLAAANGLSPTQELQQGEVIAIPGRGSADGTATASPTDTAAAEPDAARAPTQSTPVAATGTGDYVVQPGDTLSGLAARLGTTPGDIAALNGLSAQAEVIIGQRLALPGGTDAAASAAAQGPATGPGNQQLTGQTSQGPYPTAEQVSSTQVGSQASAAGVDPSLAEAIGDQESGFNNDEVSAAGAVGVMQIEPATWAFINQVLTPADPLSPDSATANVAGGVLLLHDLVAQTGSDAAAAAAYYQGLASVRAHGLYPSTEQYVRDVSALQARFGG